jgi:Rps23 Pro-64 3,4-dihydroxylase Tpa1-like proline 4-hydroxylase
MNYIEELKTKPTQIENFLSEQTAETIYKIIDSQQDWIISSNHKKSYEFEKSKFKKGEFSYWFEKIENTEFIYDLLKMLNFEFKLSNLLNDKFFIPQSIFISKYTYGSFLSKHNDSVFDRKYAFVYNLTKDVDESKGGCLQFVDKNDNITHKLLPKFNSLNIFDVENIKDLHLVDEIVDKTYKRYSISGWIIENDIKIKSKNSLI